MFRKLNKYLIILLTLTLFSANSFAKQFSFSNVKFNLDEAKFTKIVRPKLLHIVEDYYEIIKSFSPENSELIELGKNNFELLSIYQKISNIDLPSNETYAEIEKMRSILNYNEYLIFKVHNRNFSTYPNLDLDLIFFQGPLIENIVKHFLLLSELIESLNIIYSFSPESLNGKIMKQIKQYLHFYVVNVDILVSYFVSTNKQEDVKILWNGLFEPVRDNVLVNNNFEFFGNHFEDFNFTWNDFHIKSLTDKSIKLETLNRIHSEWNQVLRELL